jgi:hypothetical protein
MEFLANVRNRFRVGSAISLFQLAGKFKIRSRLFFVFGNINRKRVTILRNFLVVMHIAGDLLMESDTSETASSAKNPAR